MAQVAAAGGSKKAVLLIALMVGLGLGVPNLAAQFLGPPVSDQPDALPVGLEARADVLGQELDVRALTSEVCMSLSHTTQCVDRAALGGGLQLAVVREEFRSDITIAGLVGDQVVDLYTEDPSGVRTDIEPVPLSAAEAEGSLEGLDRGFVATIPSAEEGAFVHANLRDGSAHEASLSELLDPPDEDLVPMEELVVRLSAELRGGAARRFADSFIDGGLRRFAAPHPAWMSGSFDVPTLPGRVRNGLVLAIESNDTGWRAEALLIGVSGDEVWHARTTIDVGLDDDARSVVRVAPISEPRIMRSARDAFAILARHVTVPVAVPDLPAGVKLHPRSPVTLSREGALVDGGISLRWPGVRAPVQIAVGVTYFDGCEDPPTTPVIVGPHRGALARSGGYASLLWPVDPAAKTGTYAIHGELSDEQLLGLAEGMTPDAGSFPAAGGSGC